jgi:hypothetical protein
MHRLENIPKDQVTFSVKEALRAGARRIEIRIQPFDGKYTLIWWEF